jgi:diguanylate cyclase (GGDEF)-like protein
MQPVRATSSETTPELLEHVIGQMAGALLVWDEDWRFVYANRRAEELLGHTCGELAERTVWDVLPTIVGTSLETTLRHVMATGAEVDRDAWLEPHHRSYALHSARIPEGLMVTLRATDPAHTARLDGRGPRADDAPRLARAAAERARLAVAASELLDALTGLPNRDGFDRQLAALLDQPDCWPLSVLFVSLDRFMVVNDSLGHHASDALLVESAKRLLDTVRAEDLIGRHGGNSFAVVCPTSDVHQTIPLCEQILAAFRRPFTIGGHTLSISASIGMRGASMGSTSTTILRDANAAEHEARSEGPSRYAVFSDGTRADVLHRFEVEDELRDALRSDEIELYWQPAFDLATGSVAGVEGLVRWHHRKRGLLLPGAFVPIAEETDLILDLGRHTLVAGIRQALAWRGQLGRPCRDFGSVWVNVSARELIAPPFPEMVAATLDAMGLEPSDLGLEITETALFADAAIAVDNLARLRDLGVHLALDDFGTGHSSLTYLLRFPVDVVKIDRSFTAQVHDPTQPHRAIVSAVITATHALGGRVLAEGVEERSQLEVLTDLGCDAASGYLLARPAPAREVTPLLPSGGGGTCGPCRAR